jgi:streptomycin 6-kinase
MNLLSATFVQHTRDLYGNEGQIWLKSLPDLIEELEKEWDITVQKPFPNLTYNYLAPALTRDQTLVVLKAGFPNPELVSEIQALSLYNGNGSVRLLAADQERGAFLLEHLQPGIPLSQHPEIDDMSRITAGVIQKLLRPAPEDGNFRSISAWGRGFQRARERCQGETGPFPPKLFDRAESAFMELSASSQEPVLLHGDLHPGNILQAERAPWLAIDPKGVTGEPAYEGGAYLRNLPSFFDQTVCPATEMARQVSIMAEILEWDPARLLGWGFAQAVLASWWSVEDHGAPEESFLHAARVMERALQQI